MGQDTVHLPVDLFQIPDRLQILSGKPQGIAIPDIMTKFADILAKR